MEYQDFKDKLITDLSTLLPQVSFTVGPAGKPGEEWLICTCSYPSSDKKVINLNLYYSRYILLSIPFEKIKREVYDILTSVSIKDFGEERMSVLEVKTSLPDENDTMKPVSLFIVTNFMVSDTVYHLMEDPDTDSLILIPFGLHDMVCIREKDLPEENKDINLSVITAMVTELTDDEEDTGNKNVYYRLSLKDGFTEIKI